MTNIIKVWLISQTWFWKVRTNFMRIIFLIERSSYKNKTALSKLNGGARILMSITLIGVKSLFFVVFLLLTLGFLERYIRSNTDFLHPLSSDDRKFILDQLRLYAQLLTAIFSIYFATIGIIVSSGYTRLRRDIIQILTTEQVGSVYSRVMVTSAVFCLSATALLTCPQD